MIMEIPDQKSQSSSSNWLARFCNRARIALLYRFQGLLGLRFKYETSAEARWRAGLGSARISTWETSCWILLRLLWQKQLNMNLRFSTDGGLWYQRSRYPLPLTSPHALLNKKAHGYSSELTSVLSKQGITVH